MLCGFYIIVNDDHVADMSVGSNMHLVFYEMSYSIMFSINI